MLKSGFVINPGKKNEIFLPNFKTDEGVQQILKMITQDAAIGEDGAWYIGLCGLSADKTTTLATLSNEPSSQGGYARQLLNQDPTDWPTANIAKVNGIYRIRSAQVTFSASGDDFSVTIWRAFICNDEVGTDGILFAVSSPLPIAKLIEDGEDFDMAYEFVVD